MRRVKLGEDQRSALYYLVDRGGWPGTGWIWRNRSTTLRLLDSLVRRGLATKEAIPGLARNSVKYKAVRPDYSPVERNGEER